MVGWLAGGESWCRGRVERVGGRKGGFRAGKQARFLWNRSGPLLELALLPLWSLFLRAIRANQWARETSLLMRMGVAFNVLYARVGEGNSCVRLSTILRFLFLFGEHSTAQHSRAEHTQSSMGLLFLVSFVMDFLFYLSTSLFFFLFHSFLLIKRCLSSFFSLDC